MHFARRNFVYSYDKGVVCYRAVTVKPVEAKNEDVNPRCVSRVSRKDVRKNETNESRTTGLTKGDERKHANAKNGQECVKAKIKQRTDGKCKSGRNPLFSPIRNLRAKAKRDEASKGLQEVSTKGQIGECKIIGCFDEQRLKGDVGRHRSSTEVIGHTEEAPKITTLRSIISDYIHQPDEDRTARLAKRRYDLLAMTRRDVYGTNMTSNVYSTNDTFCASWGMFDGSSEVEDEITTVASRTFRDDGEPRVLKDELSMAKKYDKVKVAECGIKTSKMVTRAPLDSAIYPSCTRVSKNVGKNEHTQDEVPLTNESLRSKVDELDVSKNNGLKDTRGSVPEEAEIDAPESVSLPLRNSETVKVCVGAKTEDQPFHVQLSRFLTNASISFEESRCDVKNGKLEVGTSALFRGASEPGVMNRGKGTESMDLPSHQLTTCTRAQTTAINSREFELPVAKFGQLAQFSKASSAAMLFHSPHKSHPSINLHSRPIDPSPYSTSIDSCTSSKSLRLHADGGKSNVTSKNLQSNEFFSDREYKRETIEFCSPPSRISRYISKISGDFVQGTLITQKSSQMDPLPMSMPSGEEKVARARTIGSENEDEYGKSKTHPLVKTPAENVKDERVSIMETSRNGTVSIVDNLQDEETSFQTGQLDTGARGNRVEKLKVRPLKNVRDELLINGFEAAVYIINSTKHATSSLCTIMFNYDKDTLIIKSMNNLFEIDATTLVAEEIPTVPNAPILLKLSVVDVKTSAIVIQSMNGRDLEVLGGTIGWVSCQ